MPTRGPDGEDGDQHAKVADAVDQKGLLARIRIPAIEIVPAVKPEADEQVRGQPHAFPAHEHAQEVVAEHQQEHGEDEEVQEDEEALEALVVVHVAHGVDVDQAAHAGHHQGHGDAQGVDEQGHGHV